MSIPLDVATKFELEKIPNKSVEEIIDTKIQSEDGFEKEEALYLIDLGIVLKKYEQWVDHLPRVKPYYGNVFILYYLFYLIYYYSLPIQFSTNSNFFRNSNQM